MRNELKKLKRYCTRLISDWIRSDRRKQIIECLSKEKNAGFNARKNEAGRIYQEIKKQYTEIRLHRLWSNRIGEYLARYLRAVEDSRENANKGILDLFVLSDCVNHNARLSQIMGRNIYIVDETNVEIWIYILAHFPKVEFTKYWNLYSIKENDRFRNSVDTVRYFKLTDSEEGEGQYKKRLMGLKEPYVCVSCRDSAYLNAIVPTLDTSYHDYRDADINKFGLSAEYLLKKDIAVVRMGRCVKDKISFNNCIDYANQYYDELLDIVLSKDCKFYVGDSSGIVWLPMVLNRPIALRNWVPTFTNAEALPYNPQNIYIFKKYYCKSEKRFLTIKEMMRVEKMVKFDGRRYAKMGIEVVENSEEEILDLVMEMNARIDGEWVETPDDIKMQERYQTIYMEWCQKERYRKSEILNIKVGTMFLRKNAFLLN